jgi:hypothetical protein
MQMIQNQATKNGRHEVRGGAEHSQEMGLTGVSAWSHQCGRVMRVEAEAEAPSPWAVQNHVTYHMTVGLCKLSETST